MVNRYLKLSLIMFMVQINLSNLYGQGNRVSAEFIDSRIVVNLLTVNNDTLRLLADTGGGGGMMLSEPSLNRTGVPTEEMKMEGQRVRMASFSSISRQPGFPPPAMMINGESKVTSFPDMKWLFDSENGMLGHKWFANRNWKIDYLHGTLSVDVPFKTDPSDHHVCKLGFQKNMFGSRGAEFPRIEIVVDGDTLQMLFDTGATLFPSDSAKLNLKCSSPSIGISFIIDSIFSKWKIRHPDWRVIQRGDARFESQGTFSRLIEVPEVVIGGHRVGPVWFASRPDKNFLQFMSGMMDKTVVGAVGGSLFKYFTITIDYEHALAKFER